MSERDFWVSLEYRLCGEFAGLSERRYQYFWCDGFIPGHYLLDDVRPRCFRFQIAVEIDRGAGGREPAIAGRSDRRRPGSRRSITKTHE